jgi:hypothetical protein
MAIEQGLDPDQLSRLRAGPNRVPQRSFERPSVGGSARGAGLTADDSSFSRRDAVRAIAERLHDGAHLDPIETVVEQTLTRPEAVSLGSTDRAGEHLYSTSELLGIEANLLARAAAPDPTSAAVNPARAEDNGTTIVYERWVDGEEAPSG